MPANLDMILTSAVTLLIMGAVTFTVIMPIGGWLFTGMSWLFLHLNGNPFGSAVLAGLFLLAVMFGVHQGFVPVYFALVDARALTRCSRSGDGRGRAGGAALRSGGRSAIRCCEPRLKGRLFRASIGEPLIYGVTLPRMKPFVTACLRQPAAGSSSD